LNLLLAVRGKLLDSIETGGFDRHIFAYSLVLARLVYRMLRYGVEFVSRERNSIRRDIASVRSAFSNLGFQIIPAGLFDGSFWRGAARHFPK
jgi:hypothetical protein